MRLLKSIVACLLFAVPALGLAQSTSGRYATHDGEMKAEQMPDGSSVVLVRYTQSSFADDDSDPLGNTSSDCWGRLHMSADGDMQAANGVCVAFDGSGDSATSWWRLDESGTSDCPDMCGSWGYFDGTGKFDGIEGSGTWMRTTLFPNGSAGKWKGKIKLK